MERVVYFLGAGFSAPLGLPVMSNFLEKSKDLFYSAHDLDDKKRECFQEVFKAIGSMSFIKNYYRTDLFNIEEILSILAMQHSLEGRKLKEAFLQYIKDVVEHYTPKIPPFRRTLPQDWQKSLFTSAHEHGPLYGFFVGSLLQLRISGSRRRASRFDKRAAQYSVVTLNYDLVLETIANSLRAIFPDAPANFRRELEVSDGISLAKLHGSVETGLIVAPTWNKEVTQALLPDWTTAFELLSKANHIRIIGYSLPTADAYIRYLLRAAAINAQHLKRIDVLCLDDRQHSAKERYVEFIDPARLRFVPKNVIDYLQAIYKASLADVDDLELRHLEREHESFFDKHAV
jgi:hypothetical protein